MAAYTWCRRTHQTHVFVSTNDGVVLGLAIDPSGQELFATDDHGEIRSWTLADHLPSSRVRDTGANRDTIVLSSDARRLVVAGNDGDALVFERDGSGSAVRCRTGERQLDGAAFSGDGSILAAVSSDATIYVWQLSNRCDLLASAALPSLDTRQERAAHRPRLISIPSLTAFAVTDSSARVLFFSADPKHWLTRAKEIIKMSYASSRLTNTH